MTRVRAALEHLRRAAAAYAVLLVALLLTLLAYYYVQQNVRTEERGRFDETARAARDALDRRMNSYVDAMLGARALFYSSPSVQREEWSGYAKGIELEERYEGMQVLGYAKRVEPEEKDAFVEDLSRTFEDTDLPEPKLRPEGERSAYFPLKYVEPLDDINRNLLGYDMYAQPAHRAAMDEARDTGEPEATSKVYVLVKAPSGSKGDFALKEGFAVYTPVYRGGGPLDTAEERQRALDGFVVGFLEARGVLRGAFEKSFDPSIDFEVYDGKDLTSSNLLYDDDGVLRAGEPREPTESSGVIGEIPGLLVSGAERKPELHQLEQIDVAGREYGLYFEALPGSEEESNGSWLPLFVLLSGIAVSLLLFGVTFMLVRNRLRAERTSQDLEDANRELEAFSYSVSHDLRAPLRSIDGFSQILLEDYAEELDEEGKHYLDRVRSASQRMGRLIDDLLGLSRVTRSALNRRRVDLSALAEEVAGEFREANPERSVGFSAQKGLEVWGDIRLLRVALENLIGNAWKFTSKEPEAKIEFGLDEELSRRGRAPVYYVKDNGAGFEMSYADKLFGAFQRLHGASEFEGTGIGLATVQRIVRRHGGSIWAEGEVGRGATFYFTLAPGIRLDVAAPHEKARVS